VLCYLLTSLLECGACPHEQQLHHLTLAAKFSVRILPIHVAPFMKLSFSYFPLVLFSLFSCVLLAVFLSDEYVTKCNFKEDRPDEVSLEWVSDMPSVGFHLGTDYGAFMRSDEPHSLLTKIDPSLPLQSGQSIPKENTPRVTVGVYEMVSALKHSVEAHLNTTSICTASIAISTKSDNWSESVAINGLVSDIKSALDLEEFIGKGLGDAGLMAAHARIFRKSDPDLLGGWRPRRHGRTDRFGISIGFSQSELAVNTMDYLTNQLSYSHAPELGLSNCGSESGLNGTELGYWKRVEKHLDSFSKKSWPIHYGIPDRIYLYGDATDSPRFKEALYRAFPTKPELVARAFADDLDKEFAPAFGEAKALNHEIRRAYGSCMPSAGEKVPKWSCGRRSSLYPKDTYSRRAQAWQYFDHRVGCVRDTVNPFVWLGLLYMAWIICT
ncbi:hypothetical protein BJ508DRAFT_348704, partial [Ascobolus immersus RN42]